MSAFRAGLAHLGRLALTITREAHALYGTFARVMRGVVFSKWDRRSIVSQMFDIGNRSFFFVTLTIAFIGVIFVLQAGLQTRRILPDFTMIGPTYLELVVRDFAASIGALMLATRVGAGIAAELGSMAVTEQLDALRMCAADPVDFLLVPRFVASVVMTVALLVWAALVASLAGAFTAHAAFGISYEAFFNFRLLDAGDLITGLLKMIAYGSAIPVVSGHAGLSAFGGSEGVGQATTRAVVESSLAIIVLNFFLSGAALFAFSS